MKFFMALIALLCLASQGYGEPCKRIVSLAPSITEVLYALGLGDQIAGVSRYSLYPPEARQKTSIGGFFDVNVEAILTLNPDIVVGLAETREKGAQLSALGLNVHTLEHRSVKGILESFTKVGELCEVEDRARLLRSSREAEIAQVRSKVQGKPRARALVLVGEGVDEDSLRGLFVSGKDGFYSELLEIAGGENVYHGVTSGMPSLSAEGLLLLDPDVIIQVQPLESIGQEAFRSAGVIVRKLPELRAVKEGRVHIFRSDYAVVPGPRFTRLLNDFVQVLHP